jgi:hypothetical protein
MSLLSVNFGSRLARPGTGVHPSTLLRRGGNGLVSGVAKGFAAATTAEKKGKEKRV